MANKDQVVGFVPEGRLKSANTYQAGGTVYPGDMLKFSSDGTVVQCAATNASMGVAMNYAISGGQVLVADDPSQLFRGQVAASEVDAQTDIGLNCSIIVAAANTTYRRSGMELDGSTLGTSATVECKILKIVPAVDNALGEFVDVIFKINNHQLGSHTGTAGV